MGQMVVEMNARQEQILALLTGRLREKLTAKEVDEALKWGSTENTRGILRDMAKLGLVSLSHEKRLYTSFHSRSERMTALWSVTRLRRGGPIVALRFASICSSGEEKPIQQEKKARAVGTRKRHYTLSTAPRDYFPAAKERVKGDVMQTWARGPEFWRVSA